MPKPFSFRADVKGFNRVANKYRATQSFFAKETDPIGRKWMTELAAFFRNLAYPPARNYVRTYKLKRGWKAQFLKGMGKWTLINLAIQRGRHYAQWVVGDGRGKRQAGIHRAYWWIAREEIEKQAPKLTKMLTKGLRKVINK